MNDNDLDKKDFNNPDDYADEMTSDRADGELVKEVISEAEREKNGGQDNAGNSIDDEQLEDYKDDIY